MVAQINASKAHAAPAETAAKLERDRDRDQAMFGLADAVRQAKEFPVIVGTFRRDIHAELAEAFLEKGWKLTFADAGTIIEPVKG